MAQFNKRKRDFSANVTFFYSCICISAAISATYSTFYDDPFLVCGEHHLEYTLPSILSSNDSFKLTIEDHEGNMRSLTSDFFCGIWIGNDDDGSLVIFAEYDGCYITKKDNFYRMTIMIELNSTGEWEAYQKESMRCPVFQAMDASTYSKCSDVHLTDRFSCASPSTSMELCLQNDCCYDPSNPNMACYYANKVTARCTVDGHLLVVVSKNVTLPPLTLSSISFPGGSGPLCSPVAQNGAFLMFQFPLTNCGTKYKEDGDTITYENYMVANQDIRTKSAASITRDSTFRMHFRCSFAAKGSALLSVDVFTVPPPFPASSSGPLTLEMRIAKDLQYGQYYVAGDYPIIKVLQDPVFLEVHILHRNDPALTLTLNHCWATTSENALQQPQWPILLDGCPFVGDNYRTQSISIGGLSSVDRPSYYKRFIVSTFTFVDQIAQQLSGLVYFHCSASVCVSSALNSCVTTCPTTKRKRNIPNWDLGNSMMFVSAQGPINFQLDNTDEAQSTERIHDGNCSSSLKWIYAAIAIFGSLMGVIIFFIWHLRKVKLFYTRNINI